MIAGWIGRWFRALARLRPGEAGEDLARFAEELVRLEARSRQRPRISR